MQSDFVRTKTNRSDEPLVGFRLNCDQTSSFSISSVFVSAGFSFNSSWLTIVCDENSTDVRRDLRKNWWKTNKQTLVSVEYTISNYFWYLSMSFSVMNTNILVYRSWRDQWQCWMGFYSTNTTDYASVFVNDWWEMFEIELRHFALSISDEKTSRKTKSPHLTNEHCIDKLVVWRM